MARGPDANTKADLEIAMALSQCAQVIKDLSDALSFSDVDAHLELADRSANYLVQMIRGARGALKR